MENIVLATFAEESLAYQAYSEVKNSPCTDACTVSELALIQKKDGKLTVKELYDSGLQTSDDTMAGGLVGLIVGILGGPIGMLLGASLGMLVGTAVDVGDASENATYLENAAAKISDGQTALVALAIETDRTVLDGTLSKFHPAIVRYEAAILQEEVDAAIDLQDRLIDQVQDEMRSEAFTAGKARLAKLSKEPEAQLP